MSRRTIDFGIDLGTTNSEIACMDKGKLIVLRNYKQEEFTPSVVRIDEKGTIRAGRKAYERLVDDDDNTVGEFKRWMGTQQYKEFISSKRKLNPEELSAEVLKDLKMTSRKYFPDEDEMSCAVITVPCNFETVQCEATQRAAKIAGIKFAPLLQEPIAASIAYGFLEKMPKGYWIIYDLGGGTFDVAIMSAKEGSLSVVDHCGDNYLGGKDFDWKIVENFVYPILSKEYNLPNLGRKEKKYKPLNAVLKASAEEAKIELSQMEQSEIVLDLARLKDEDGKEIHINIPIMRTQFIPLIEKYIDRTIDFFSQVLKKQGLSASDISQLILVGGPTQIPYVRSRLKDAFKIPIEYKIDPITVVAQGAAIFAASQLIPEGEGIVKRDYSKVFVKLAYAPMTTETDLMVGGKFYPAENSKSIPDNVKVQISRTSGDWESGLIEVKDNAFVTNVNLLEGKANSFTLSLMDESGNKIPVDPDSFTINQGISVAQPPLIRSIGVELEDGTFRKHIEKGTALPNPRIPITYHTTKTVRPGQDEDCLKIHVWEGEYETAKYNRYLGTMLITGKDVSRTLPEDSEIEIIIVVDQSRAVSIEAFIPYLDKKFSDIRKNLRSPKPQPEHLRDDLKGEEERLKEIKQKIRQADDKSIERKLTEIQLSSSIEELKMDLKAAEGGDPDAIEKADRGLKEIKHNLDEIEHLTEWPVAIREFNAISADCEQVVTSHGTDEDKDQLSSLRKEADKAISNKDINRLRTLSQEIINVRLAVLFRQPGFWIAAFQEIKKNPSRFTNQERAEELIEEGSIALQRQDILDSLKSVVWELWSLMPPEDEERNKEIASDAGIR